MTQRVVSEFVLEVPKGDDKERRVCQKCDFIDYQNPKIVAGAVVQSGDKILLCKREIEPRRGYWTLPAGYMELGETVEDAARREAQEEALADIEIDRMLAVYSVARIGQVHIMYRATLKSGFGVGPESQEVALYEWKDIPWRSLAFPTVVWALTHFAQTRNQSVFPAFSNPSGTDAITR